MTGGKIRSRDGARRWRRNQPGGVVFTNGVFDLLHCGHVELLERARGFGDHLVVGVNDDASTRALHKTPERPFVPAGDRARVIAALACVDCVVMFDELTPEQLIADLTPDVLVKGADWDPETLPGSRGVRARGGSVRIIPLLAGQSTTAIVERIRAAP